MFPVNNVMSSRFMQDGVHTTAQSMPSEKIKTQRSMAIDSAMSTIEEMAKEKNLNTVITVLLSKSVPSLEMYITSQNEKPMRTVDEMALQAALLRMADTAVFAHNLDVNDYDATCLLEEAENEAIERGHFQAKYILPYDTQAALNFVIDRIISKHKAAGGSGKMNDIVNQIKSNQPGNYFDSPMGKEGMDTYHAGGGVIYTNDHANIDNYELIKGDDLPTDASTPILTKEPSSGIMDFIDKAVGVIQDIGGGIKTVADNTGNAIDNLKDSVTDLGGDIAAGSLQKALVKNLPLIFGIVIAITLIIIGIVYVTKRKS
jgi:hypothetical protein